MFIIVRDPFRYLPCLLPPMSAADLEAQAEADRRLQEQLRLGGFGPGDQSRKRGLQDELD